MDKDCKNSLTYNTIDVLKLIMALVAIHTTDYVTFESPFANDLLQYVNVLQYHSSLQFLVISYTVNWLFFQRKNMMRFMIKQYERR